MALNAGKRIAPHMPYIIGAWLAGTYDNDRLVRKAADEALQQSFSSGEKRHNLWKIYPRAILGHARDRILCETVRTLSDERIVSQEDAEAKHARVVATGISLLLGIIGEWKSFLQESRLIFFTGELDEKEINSGRDLLSQILEDKKLWDFSVHRDPFVRRTVYGLIILELEKQTGMTRQSLTCLYVL